MTLLLGSCASLPARAPAPPSSALTDVADAVIARVALARAAQKSLDAQYDLLRPEAIGPATMRAVGATC